MGHVGMFAFGTSDIKIATLMSFRHEHAYAESQEKAPGWCCDPCITRDMM